MSLVTMGWRRQPERPSNFFGKDEAGPHDEQLEAAAIADARAAVIKKAMLGCELAVDELATAHLTQVEAVHEADLLLERTETDLKRLTEPPKPIEPQRAPTFTHVPDPEPERPARKRRKRRDTKLLMRKAIERRHDERELFTD